MNAWEKVRAEGYRKSQVGGGRCHYFIKGGWVRSLLIRRCFNIKVNKKWTGSEGTCAKLFQSRGMVNAKDVKPKQLGIFVEAKRALRLEQQQSSRRGDHGREETGTTGGYDHSVTLAVGRAQILQCKWRRWKTREKLNEIVQSMDVAAWTQLVTGWHAQITGIYAKESCKNLQEIICEDFYKNSDGERTSMNVNNRSPVRNYINLEIFCFPP